MNENRPNKGTVLTCPQCNKEFKLTDYHSYLIGKNYACSWKCFLKAYHNTQKEKSVKENQTTKTVENNQPKRKRGRPKRK